MINYRSVNFFLLMITFITIVFSLFGIFNLQLLDVAAYLSLFGGIYFFYSSYLKKYKSGIVLGSAFFLTGSVIFVITQHEILNFGSVFVPSVLIIIGTSLLIANILTQINGTAVLFSTLSLIAGIWLMIARGSTNMDLFLSAAYALIKNYWIIILVSAGIIYVVTKRFKKKDVDQN